MSDRRPDRPGGTDQTMLTAVPVAARAFQGSRAGVVSRCLSALVDTAAVAAMLCAGYFGIAGLLLLWSPRKAHLPDIPRPAILIAAAIVCIAYLSVSWATTGRTYGGRLFGLRVVDRRGGTAGIAVALARAVLCTAIPLGLLWAAVSRTRSSLADLVVRTSVVYDWVSRSPGSSSDSPDATSTAAASADSVAVARPW